MTADALHGRTDTARAILDTGADYALAAKANQSTLLDRAQALTAAAADPQGCAVDGPSRAYDRIERRTACVEPAKATDFPGIAAVARVETPRTAACGEEPVLIRWFLLSVAVPAERMLAIARSHGAIGNQLPRILDAALAKDAAHSRKDYAPQTLAMR